MCNALEELVNEGFQKGFQEGFQLQKEKLLRGCIRAGKENDVDEETVALQKLPFYKNYRKLSYMLIALCLIVLLVFA